MGDAQSTTTDIHEYRIRMPLAELGLNNTELRIVDTPGVLDTRGLEQEARFVATLDAYLRNHEDLKRSIPNVVLIFLRFDDNRFAGYGSNFVRMLRTLDLFGEKLYDKKFSNVIFVATHYMSEVRDTVRRPNSRIAALKRVIQEHTLIPAPIIITMAENKPHATGLLSVNGFYALPNGQFYPRNLFDRIQLVTTAGGDPIGEAVIRNAFKSPDFSFCPDKIREFVYPLLAPSHARVTKFMGTLIALNRNPANTEISRALDQAFESQSDPNFDTEQLGSLQRTFYLNRISTYDDLPTTSEDNFKFFKQLQRHPAVLHIVRSAFNLTAPKFDPANYMFVGYGYDVMGDVSLPSTPLLESGFESNADDWVLTDARLLMPPRMYKCEPRAEVRTEFRMFETKEDYFRNRLDSVLGPGRGNLLEAIQNPKLVVHAKPGHNILTSDSESGMSRFLELSTVVEYQTFSLALNHDTIQLNTDFLDSVAGLADFNSSDRNIVSAWQQFFEKYGTHIVDSSLGGGYIEVVVKRANSRAENETDDDPLETHRILTQAASKIVDFVAGLMVGRETRLDLDAGEVEYNIRFGGGSSKYKVHNLSDSDVRTKLGNWKESLAYEPTLLTQNDRFKLLQISQLFQGPDDDGTHAEKIAAAVSALFNSSLTYSGEEEESWGLLDRSQTEVVPMTAADYVALKELAQMLQAMADKARERNEMLITKLTEEQTAAAVKDAAERKSRQEQFTEAMKASVAAVQNLGKGEQGGGITTAKDVGQKFDEQRQEYLQAAKLDEQRHQQMLNMIMEVNNKAAERRKNSFLNRLIDNLLPGLVTRLVNLIPGGKSAEMGKMVGNVSPRYLEKDTKLDPTR